MNGKEKYKCCKCNKQLPLRRLKKLRDGLYCLNCQTKKRKEHRLNLKETLIKEGLMKKRKTKQELPKIKFTKEKQKKLSKKQVSKKLRTLYISKTEKDVLYPKFKKKGFTSKESNERIKKLCLQMEIVKEKLKNENLEEKEINEKFLEEYNKLIEKATR